MNDEDSPRKPVIHQMGEALDTLSLEELEERIELLKLEIDRLSAAMSAKRKSADIADSFFKK